MLELYIVIQGQDKAKIHAFIMRVSFSHNTKVCYNIRLRQIVKPQQSAINIHTPIIGIGSVTIPVLYRGPKTIWLLEGAMYFLPELKKKFTQNKNQTIFLT